MDKRIFLGVTFLFCVLMAGVSLACTDFQVKAKDGTVVIGRSMEFAMGMGSEIVVFPRGGKVTSMTPDGKKGISWTRKYGYLGIDAFKEKQAVLDGINEAGLAVEFLWFTESQYQKAHDSNWLAITDLGHWMLGNFSSVNEIKRELPKLKVVGVYVPQLRQVPGFHAAVHDARGNNIVIEFIRGEINIYDNPIGVMTNKPTFDWMLTNLRNYVNLDPYDRPSVNIAGNKINATGSGTGWLGMPGDWSPPSRFVRTVQIVHAADPAKDAAGAVNLAEHVLNAVDIPVGVIKTKGPINQDMVDYTQWIVVKDLTNRVLYYRSYQDLTLKRVDMKKLNFEPGAPIKSILLEDGSRNIINVTGKLM